MSDIFSVENAGAMWVATFVFAFLFCVFWIFLQWKIFAKAGYSGALALVNLAMFIPYVGILIVIGLQVWFAFAAWPALNKAPQA
jgi:hypothetical protein